MSIVCAIPLEAAEQWRGTSVDDWRGWTVLPGGKGYVSTPMGQLHYRDIGPRDYKTPIVLLHQSPASMIQFAKVQNAFAEMGIRAIAVDTPGYGMSDLPPRQPTIEEYADNIVPLLDHLNIDKVVIAGHHTGAEIAASFAVNHSDRVASIIMHGAALMTDEETQSYLNMKRIPRTPLANGSHLSRWFRIKSPPDSQDILDAKTMLTLTTFIQGPDIGHWAAYQYDILPDLKAITVPGMIMSDAGDGVHEMDLRAAKVRPDFKYVEFSKGGPLEFMVQPTRWAKIAAEFMVSVQK